MSYVKRQALFDNFNPLLKKFATEGPVPPQYIPAKKRKIIARYMGRSSVNPGYGKSICVADTVTDAEPLSSTKLASDAIALSADYNKSVADRIKEGNLVKKFMEAQRIKYGRDNSDGRIYQRSNGYSKSLNKHLQDSPYSKMIATRNNIKNNTEKINLFVDKNVPEFINSMSRTMNAFDNRMSTFG